MNDLPANRYATATQMIVTYAYAQNDRRDSGTSFFTTSNLAVPAEQFRPLGGFSEAFPLAAGEDYDFCHRWQHSGLKAVYVPEAVVRHAHALTLGKLSVVSTSTMAAVCTAAAGASRIGTEAGFGRGAGFLPRACCDIRCGRRAARRLAWFCWCWRLRRHACRCRARVAARRSFGRRLPRVCRGNRRSVNQMLPSFSVVIPTYSRPAQLAECLRSLSGIDYPRDRLR